MRETSVTMGVRGKLLNHLDSCYQWYLGSRNKQAAEPLDKAITAYRKAEPNWRKSSRNSTHIMSNMFAQFFKDFAQWQDRRDFIWSPSHNDNAMRSGAGEYISQLSMNPVWHGGGKPETDLSKMAIDKTLYVMAHGHGNLPLFTVGDEKFTATQMAAALVKDGLRPEHRKIVLLVCHAGESVNSIESAEEVARLQREMDARKALIAKHEHHSNQGIAAAVAIVERATADRAQMRTDFANMTRNATHGYREQEFFENFSSEEIKKQLLPMAAQLSAAMKAKGYENFVLRSFKAEVVNIPKNGKVCLKLEGAHNNDTERAVLAALPPGTNLGEVPVDLVPTYCVDWR